MDLEVEIDLVESEGYVLIGFGLDRQLELFLFLAGRHDDLLRDHHGRGQRHGNIAVAAPQAFPAAFEGVAHLIEVGDVAVGDCILGQRLDRVALEAIGALPGFRQFHQLERRRCDIDPDQRWGLRLEEVEGCCELFCDHGRAPPEC